MGDAGPFMLQELIGDGASGNVWRARDGFGAEVAVKVLAQDARAEHNRRAFRREIAGLAGLDHPAVIRVHDAGVVEHDGRLPAGSPWVAMELATASLADRAPSDFAGIVGLLDPLLAGLAHAHAHGLVHRDLKPANVLLTERGWAIADFGLAHAFVEARTATIGGTPFYMAPEQWTSAPGLLGPWTDLYALGCTLWTLTTGRHLFEGTVSALREAHREQRPGPYRPTMVVPEGFERWLSRLLAKRPADRFPSAPEAREALFQLASLPDLEGDGEATFSFDPSQRTGALGRRRFRPSFPESWRPARSLAGPIGWGLFGVRSPALVGRDPVQDRLWKHLGAVIRTGRSEVLVLRGHPEVGVPAIARWLLVRAMEVGVAAGLFATHHAPVATQDGLGPMFVRHLRLTGLEPGAVRAVLDSRVPDTADNLFSLVCPEEGEVLPPRARALVAWSALQELAAADGALVVWLADGDRSPEAVELARLARGADCRVLVVVTVAVAVPEAAASGLDLLPTQEVPPLSTAALRSLGASLGLSPGTQADLVAHVDGSPTRLLALVAGWVQRNELKRGPDGWSGPALAGDQVTLAAHTDRVLRPLPEVVREAFELAALVGTEIEWSDWETLARLEESSTVVQSLVRLEDARLVETTPDGFRFTSGAVRDAILAGLLRRGEHERLRKRTYSFLRDRAARERDRGRVLSSSGYLGRAYALAASDDERQRVGATWLNVLRIEDRLVEAQQVRDAMLASTMVDPTDEAIFHGNVGSLHYELGDWERARVDWGRAITRHAALGRTDSVALNRRNLAVLDRLQGRWEASRVVLTDLLAAEVASGNVAGATRTHLLLARLYTEGAQHRGSVWVTPARTHLQAAQHGGADTDVRTSAMLTQDLAALRYEVDGDGAGALALLGEATGNCLRAGLLRLAAGVAAEWAMLSAELGGVDEGLAELERFAQHVRIQSGSRLLRLSLGAATAAVLLRAGVHDQALDTATRVVQELRGMGSISELEPLLVVARAQAARGNGDAAWAALVEAQELTNELGMPSSGALVVVVSGQVAVALGDRPAAGRAADRATRLVAEHQALPNGAAVRGLRSLRGLLER